jgi:hypothetical protein
MPKATMNKVPELPSRTMEELNIMRIIITAAGCVMIFLLTLAMAIVGGPIVGLVTLMILSALFLADSFVYADAGRFQKIIPRVLGVFVNELEGPGFVYLPLKTVLPFLLSYEFKDGGEVEFDFAVEENLCGSEEKISLENQFYLIPDPRNPVKLIEIGGFDKACKRLEGQVGQRERNWVLSKTEGPQTLDEARGMKDEAIHTILQMLLEDDLRRLAPDISDEVILGFIKGRPPATIEQKLMAETLEQKDPTEKEDILAAGRELLALIQKTRTGELSLALHNLGLIVNRFGVDNIKGVGATAAGMDEIAKATLEAQKRKVVAQGYADSAAIIAKAPGFKGNSMDTMLVAEKVVKKEIKETEFGFSDPLVQTAQILLTPITTAIASKIAGK